MVVTTSLTFSFTLRMPGIHAYSTARDHRRQQRAGDDHPRGRARISRAPTTAAASPPKYSCPSPPTLKMPALRRNAHRKAR